MFFNKEKDSICIIVRANGISSGCYLRLPVTYDKKNYEPYIILEQVVGRGNSQEVLRCDLANIDTIEYKKPFFGSLCTLSIMTNDNNTILSDLKIEKDLFDVSTIKKLQKILSDYSLHGSGLRKP